MFLRQIIHEFTYGPLTAEAGRQLREGSLHTTVHIEIAIDAMSVFSAVTADRVKAPAEKSLLSHIQFVRELLDKGIVRAIMWLDTRDMTADGMTKGSVDRKAIEDCMSGTITFQHDLKRWEPLLRKHIKPFFILATNHRRHAYSRAVQLPDDGTEAKQKASICDLKCCTSIRDFESCPRGIPCTKSEQLDCTILHKSNVHICEEFVCAGLQMLSFSVSKIILRTRNV